MPAAATAPASAVVVVDAAAAAVSSTACCFFCCFCFCRASQWCCLRCCAGVLLLVVHVVPGDPGAPALDRPGGTGALHTVVPGARACCRVWYLLSAHVHSLAVGRRRGKGSGLGGWCIQAAGVKVCRVYVDLNLLELSELVKEWRMTAPLLCRLPEARVVHLLTHGRMTRTAASLTGRRTWRTCTTPFSASQGCP